MLTDQSLKINNRKISNQKRLWYRLYLLVGTIIVITIALIISRMHAARQLQKQTKQAATPIVAVITAAAQGGVDTIILPGNVQAWHEAPIYARTNGYIKKWYVDIGSHVKKGQLLADIETPELDAQLQQAQATLNTAIANNNFAQTTAKRWRDLLTTQSVSQQEADEKISAAKALEAVVIATRANVQRLQELVGFEQVTAPFSGTITARTTDIGALINAGSSTTAHPLFKISQNNPLRVYVNIPQNYSAKITSNMTVMLHFAEHPGKQFKARLLKTAQAINPATRTLLAQFITNNNNGELLAGSYTEVHFSLPTLNTTIRLPVNVLLFRAQGTQVAIVDEHHKVVLKSITISRDFGTELEVDTGIKPGERIIINPSDTIIAGEKVRVVAHAKH